MGTGFFIFIAFILLIAATYSAACHPNKITYPAEENPLYLDPRKYKEYSTLANTIGFEIGRTYSYSDFADVKRNHRIGTPGNYEPLLLSTGGDPWEWEATQLFNEQNAGWEMNYYKNHDMTVIHEVRHDSDRIHSWVRILKIGEGRRPKLNLE